jgi:hypothetical protein
MVSFSLMLSMRGRLYMSACQHSTRVSKMWLGQLSGRAVLSPNVPSGKMFSYNCNITIIIIIIILVIVTTTTTITITIIITIIIIIVVIVNILIIITNKYADTDKS